MASEISSPYCMMSVINCVLYIGYFPRTVKWLCLKKASIFSGDSTIQLKIQMFRTVPGHVRGFNMGEP